MADVPPASAAASISVVESIRHRTEHGTLAIRRVADGAPTLVCLHGFTLHGGMFAGLAPFTHCGLLAPDLPGHGATDLDPVDLETTLAVLAGWMESLPAPAPLLGYSQGGRIALQLALRHPDLVRQLLLVSTSAGLPDAERAVRRDADEAMASRIERQGLAAFLDEWLAQPLVGTGHIDAGRASADRALRMENSAKGLAAALRGLGQGVVAAIDPGDLAVRATWIAGEHDTRYAAAAQRYGSQSGGDVWIVPGTGHNVVLAAPQTLGRIIDHCVRGTGS